MPLVRKLDKDLWEVRIRLPDRIARVLFTVCKFSTRHAPRFALARHRGSAPCSFRPFSLEIALDRSLALHPTTPSESAIYFHDPRATLEAQSRSARSPTQITIYEL